MTADSLSLRLVEILFPIFGIVAAGYFYARHHKPEMAVANRLNMDVFVPALVFAAMAGKSFAIAAYGPLALAALFVLLGSGLLAWPVARLLKVQARTFVPPMMFNNSGNIGLPLAVLAWGEDALPAAVILFMVENTLHFSFGARLLDPGARLLTLWRVPVVFAAIAGLTVAVLKIPVWQPLVIAIKMLGDVSVPLLLFSLGVRMTDVSFREWRLATGSALLRPLAGMLIAETEFKHQVETDIRPFHDVLLGLFFITIGMKLNYEPVLQQWWLVGLLALFPIAAKFALIALLARGFGAPPGTSLRTGLYLAQAGEFGFVLLGLGAEHALVGQEWLSPVLAAMVVSMLATPFIVMSANRIVMRLSSSDWLLQSVQFTSIAKKAFKTDAHVIICGFGRSGQNLAQMLEGERIPYMALDLDPDRVRQAAAAGRSVVFGDAARLQALMAAGLNRAACVVISYHDTPSALKVLRQIRAHAPSVPVIVRTLDDADLDRLREAGATEVVPEAIEGSLMLASHALALVGVPMQRVIRLTRDARDARYGLLRGYFHGADDDTVEELHQARLLSVSLPAGAACLGQRLDELALHAVGVQVVSVRRASGAVRPAHDALELQGGDTLVLAGTPEALALAEDKLLRA